MKKLPEQKNPVLGLMRYEDALSHLKYSLSEYANFSLNKECISAISFALLEGQIDSFIVKYNKICISLENRIFYWPVQEHSMNISKEEGMYLMKQFME